MRSAARGCTSRGIKLPPEVLEKFYHGNAERLSLAETSRTVIVVTSSPRSEAVPCNDLRFGHESRHPSGHRGWFKTRPPASILPTFGYLPNIFREVVLLLQTFFPVKTPIRLPRGSVI